MASFLAALDRFGGRYPGGRQERLAAWKRTFLRAYFERSNAATAEDLTFFYAWNLLQMCQQHVGERSRIAPYLRWYYGRHLERYLVQLQRLSAEEIARSPASLFEDGVCEANAPQAMRVALV